jgi:hypothetical protein
MQRIRTSGGGDHATVPDSDSLDITDAITIQAWIKPGAGKSTQYVLYKGGSFIFPYTTDAWQTLSVSLSGLTSKSIPYNKIDEWHHVTMTYDSSLASDNLKIYIDGELAGSWDQTGQIATSSNVLNLGREYYQGYGFKGYLDEVIIYNRALSAEEVKDSYDTWAESAIANDTSGGGDGIQTGDTVVITFSGETNGATINASNIDTVLALSSGHSWLDCNFNIGSAEWSTTTYTNDTLTITLSNNGCAPSVALRDIITLDGTIKDKYGKPVIDTVIIQGNFGYIPDGMVLYLRLDENGTDPLPGDGFDIYDETNNSNHGYLGGARETDESSADPDWLSNGRFGSALDFFTWYHSGRHAYCPVWATVPDSDSLDLTDKLTIQTWIYAKIYNNTQYAISKDGSYIFPKTSDNWTHLEASLYISGVGWVTRSVPYSKVGEWHHVTLTYDNSLPGNNLKIYIDGELAGSWDQTGSIGISSNPLMIGSNTTGNDSRANGYDGYLDEVIIYNRALSAEEVKESSSSAITSAVADDTSGGGNGIQAGDTVAVIFSGATDGAVIDSSNIDTVLSLNNGHSWLDGSGGIGSAVWSTTIYTNDTLTITLSTNGGVPSVAPLDVITLDGSTIKDKNGKPIIGSITISGTFDSVQDSTVLYLKFDENGSDPVIGDSFDIYDETANSNHGYLGTSPESEDRNDPDWASGRFGSALNFTDAADPSKWWGDHCTVPDSDSLDITDAITIQAWINTRAGKSSQYVLYKGGSYIFPRTSDNWQYLQASLYISGVGWVTRGVPYADRIGEWHHVTLTYDSGLASGNLKIYIDGEVVGEWDQSGQVGVSSNPLMIGSDNTGNDARANGYDGYLDEVIIYNRALTPDEVRLQYGTPIGLESAIASDTSGGGGGIQAGDQIVITFNGPTAGTPIDSSNIDSALALNNGHSWLDGSGNIGSAVWSTNTYTNDTLTITLSTNVSLPTVAVDDIITLDGTVKDKSGNSIIDSISITGSFGVSAPSGAVAYWKFDEGSGTTAYDTTVNNNDGTLYGLPTWTADSKSGLALSFNGSTDYVEIPDSASLSFGASDSFTLEAWVKTSTTGNQKRIISLQYGTSTMAIWLRTMNDNTVQFFIRDSNGNTTYFYSTSTITDGQWHHVVGVRDVNNDRLYLYIDGVEENSVTDTTNGSFDTTDPWYIGYEADSSGGQGGKQYWSGQIDEVVIYNRALSATEVLDRYNLYGP